MHGKKIFVVPSLSIKTIMAYIKLNYSSFPIIQLDFEYDKFSDRWRLIVLLSVDQHSLFVVSLRSIWFTSFGFAKEHSFMKKFIDNIDELPF